MESQQPKIIDGFIFYNELDLLTYRLNILKDEVDYFVLVESRHTFTGKEKRLYYDENKHLYETFKDKIIHVIVEDMPYIYPHIIINTDKEGAGDQWKNEHFQRNAIVRGIDRLALCDQDIILISDVDEIPNPHILHYIRQNKIAIQGHTLMLDMYYYNLNCKFVNKWFLFKIVSYKTFNAHNRSCQTIRNTNFPIVTKGGWHLSYFGDTDFIRNKIENFSHQELNYEKFKSKDAIEEKIRNCIDLFGRSDIKYTFIPIKDNDFLPPQHETYLKNFIISE